MHWVNGRSSSISTSKLAEDTAVDAMYVSTTMPQNNTEKNNPLPRSPDSQLNAGTRRWPGWNPAFQKPPAALHLMRSRLKTRKVHGLG
ncbi:MAG: hypothetical protein V7693_10120 [Halopseudomonas sabulinigri]